jgi:predicted Na+-dependent transporter
MIETTAFIWMKWISGFLLLIFSSIGLTLFVNDFKSRAARNWCLLIGMILLDISTISIMFVLLT